MLCRYYFVISMMGLIVVAVAVAVAALRLSLYVWMSGQAYKDDISMDWQAVVGT